MDMMNIATKFRSLPIKTRRLLGIGVLLGLFAALPLFIWAIITQNFNIQKKAASSEPGVCIAQNGVIEVTPNTDINGTCHNIQTAIDAAGNGFKVLIRPGIYNPSSTINVIGKTNITITGDAQQGNDAAVINFVPGGWGFMVDNSTGSIEWLTIQGGSTNGMLSIKNTDRFAVGYSKISSNTSHTFDAQNSKNISVYNSEIHSSAGGLEFVIVDGVHVLNSQITDTDNAIALNNSSNIEIIGNKINGNRESAIHMHNTQNLKVEHNTIVNNATKGTGFPAVLVSGTVYGGFDFFNNIVAFNQGSGFRFDSQNYAAAFQHNDTWMNPGGNYVGITSQVGNAGNIAQDPKLNFSSYPITYCLLPGSPALYGNVANGEYMGYIGPCTNYPSPTPTPTITPAPSCMPRPACLDATPACLPPEPINGWCPTPIPTPTPSNLRINWNSANLKLTASDLQLRFTVQPNDNYVYGQNFANLSTGSYKYSDKINTYHFYSFWHENSKDLGIAFDIVKEDSTNKWHIEELYTLNPSQTPSDLIYFRNSVLASAPNGGSWTKGVWNLTSDNSIAQLAFSEITMTPDFSQSPTMPPAPTTTPSGSPKPGDVNGDGLVNIVDIGIVIDNYRIVPIPNPKADLNNDGVANIVDIGIIIDNYLK